MCLPYKVLLGNLIEGLERGADTVLNVGGPNLCRLGCYAKLQEQTLRSMGFNFEMVIFDWQEQQIIGLARFIRRLLGDNKPWIRIAGDIRHGIFGQLRLMEELEQHVHRVRPREREKGAASAVWRNAGDRVAAAHTPEQLKRTRRELFDELDSIPLDPHTQPPRVKLLGEFFVAIDPFCNMDIEEELGKRGIEVTRAAYLTEWAKIWLLLEALGLGHDRKVKKAASPYLSRDVSGDAMQSVGETILHRKEGFDGIIHIMPFTCLPEIIAQNIMLKVTKEHQIPVLTVIVDEQTSKTALITRLEAFVDLMERRHRHAILTERR
jgi:predicted nucleotide-binding protein (sugar kinase/HSP70/actin superfamily)